MMRIALFLLTNLAVMVVFGLVLSLTGIQSSSVQGLMIMALLFGDFLSDGRKACKSARMLERFSGRLFVSFE